MKKLFIAAMAVMLCVCFALPAVAEVKITGMIWVDAYIRDISKEALGAVAKPGGTTTQNGYTDFQINGPLPVNYVNFAYTNSKATYGAVMTLGNGYINDWSTWNMAFSQSYIWWKPMSAMRIRVGKISQAVGGLAPTDNLGMSEYYRKLDDPAATGTFTGTGGMASGPGTGEVPAAISFGNFHTTAKPGIDLNYKFNDMVSLNVALYDPDYDNVDNDNFTLLSTRGAGTTAIQEGVLPRFDIAVPLRFGKFYIQPKAGWLRKDYDQVAAGQDDSFDIWMAGADASISFGPITLMAEYVYGQNLGAGNFTGGLSTQGPRAYTVAGKTSISDTDTNMYWAQINWSITPKMLASAAYGKLKEEDEVNPATALDDWRITRSFMSLALRYALGPNLFIQPQWSRHWYGDDNKFGAGTLTFDSGDLDLYGVSFYILF